MAALGNQCFLRKISNECDRPHGSVSNDALVPAGVHTSCQKLILHQKCDSWKFCRSFSLVCLRECGLKAACARWRGGCAFSAIFAVRTRSEGGPGRNDSFHCENLAQYLPKSGFVCLSVLDCPASGQHPRPLSPGPPGAMSLWPPGHGSISGKRMSNSSVFIVLLVVSAETLSGIRRLLKSSKTTTVGPDALRPGIGVCHLRDGHWLGCSTKGLLFSDSANKNNTSLL